MEEYDKLILRIEPFAGPERYEVFVEGAGYEAHGRFDLPFQDEALENFVLRMSRRRQATRRIETSDATRAKEFGGRLFNALVQGEVRDLYRDARNQARRRGRGLRITLALTKTPELMDVPWEFLYDEPDFLSVSEWTPVVRYLDLTRPRDPLPVDPPLRILGMVSDVPDLAPLDVEAERERLERAVGALVRRGQVEVQWTRRATLDALLRKLRAGPFHIFHFVGHGGYHEDDEDGVLFLEGVDGRSQEVPGGDLGTILCDHTTLRLAVLNACEGARSARTDPFAGVAASLVQRGLPAVAAMQFEITDAAAVTFAEHFYAAIATGQAVDAALGSARKGMFAAGHGVEWATPVLFMRPSDGHVFALRDRPLSEHAQLAVSALEVRPAWGDAGQAVEYTLHVENVGRPSLRSVTPRDAHEQPLDDPVDLMPREDTTFSWSAPGEPGDRPDVVVTATQPAGPPLRVPATGPPFVVDEERGVARGATPPRSGEAPTSERAHPPGTQPTTVERTAPRGWVRRGTAALVTLIVLALGAVVAIRSDGEGEVDRPARPGPRVEEPVVAPLGKLGSVPQGVAVAEGKAWVISHGRDRIAFVDEKRPALPVQVGPRIGKGANDIAVGGGVVWVGIGGDTLEVKAFSPSGDRYRGGRSGVRPAAIAAHRDFLWIAVRKPGADELLRVRRGGSSLAGKPIQVHADLWDVAADENDIWLVTRFSDELVRIDRKSERSTGSVRVGREPRAVAFAAGAAWVVDLEGDRVFRVDAETMTRRAFPVGDRPRNIAATERHVWVANEGDDTISRIDPVRPRVVGKPVPVGRQPYGLAITDDHVWVTSQADNSVMRVPQARATDR